jgi:low density lipoprotein-related protein 2
MYVFIVARKLYWCDGSTRHIESINLDGSGRHTVLTVAASHLFGVVMFNNNLYYTDWSQQ